MSVLALLLSHLLAAYAALAEPLLGVRLYGDLEREAGQDDRARRRFYRLGLAVEWSWVFVVGLIVAFGGPSLGALGLRWEAPPAEVLGFVAAVGLGSLVPVAALWLRSLRRSGEPGVRESLRRMLEPVGALLPRTKGERRAFAALCVTAGICEEILFRGFLMFYLQEVFPGLGIAGAVVVSSAVFGLAHLYQGLAGVLTTGALGVGMAMLYAAGGSLVVPIVLHALLDLRILLIHRPQEARRAEA